MGQSQEIYRFSSHHMEREVVSQRVEQRDEINNPDRYSLAAFPVN
jgi:hypothetical protein